MLTYLNQQLPSFLQNIWMLIKALVCISVITSIIIWLILIQALWFLVQTATTAAESRLVWEDEICSIWSRYSQWANQWYGWRGWRTAAPDPMTHTHTHAQKGSDRLRRWLLLKAKPLILWKVSFVLFDSNHFGKEWKQLNGRKSKSFRTKRIS